MARYVTIPDWEYDEAIIDSTIAIKLTVSGYSDKKNSEDKNFYKQIYSRTHYWRGQAYEYKRELSKAGEDFAEALYFAPVYSKLFAKHFFYLEDLFYYKKYKIQPVRKLYRFCWRNYKNMG